MTVDAIWLGRLATLLASDEITTMLDSLRALLGEDARIAAWRPTGGGWTHGWGDELPLPEPAPTAPTQRREGSRAVVHVGDDATVARLLVVDAPSLESDTLDAVASMLGVAVGRIVERRAAMAARQRLADNERIGKLGSYDWHVPTDTNRWSDQLFRIYGEDPQSFNASYERFMAFIHPDDREKVAGIHQEAFATGEPYEMEERIVLADGTERLLWSNGEVIPGTDGSPDRFIGICRDVTDERAAERDAEAAEGLRQRAHDAEIRRRAALEMNDVVVQGLTAVTWSLDIGAAEVARELLDQTLGDARHMMDDLLVGPDGRAPEAGELRRTHAPTANVATEQLRDHESSSAEPASGERARRVVLADDAPDVRLLLRIQLERMGLEVVGEAVNGLEAVELVEAHSPDVVLLDLSMPLMDGLEATRTIRAAHPDMRIVIVSGYGADSMSAAAMEAGADSYVEKGSGLSSKLSMALGFANV